ncbi:helix-turn-helix transcriptional regulator [Paenibacillus sp. GYB004]|uniref:helix-turn-helix domain-containing protein n=1 Tax=Paenibacillus sp. GYB004 TaxID=2994393 RepID=UPI002F961B31
MLRLKLDKILYDRRITVNQLSKMTGIRWNTINDLAENTARHWSPDNLEKIMVSLEINRIEDLIEYVEGDEGDATENQ